MTKIAIHMLHLKVDLVVLVENCLPANNIVVVMPYSQA